MKLSFLNRSVLGAVTMAAALCMNVPTAGAASLLDRIEQNKVLRVAIDLNVPPYAMKDENLKETGSDVETAKLFAEDMGVKLEIVPTTLANRIPFLMTDKADIVISALSITPERAKVIDFSIPFAAIESVIAAPESVNIKSMADLAGKTIVTPRGTTNDANVTRLAPKDANIVRLETDATAMTAITSGRTNIYAGAPAIIHALNEKLVKQGDAPLVTKVVMATAMLGVGVKKGQPELVEKINGLIRANLKNGKLNEIYKKYHGADLPAAVMAEAE
ncbi:transporter substrate-binding domain-containing protein [Castellaniella defragrans]|uniref:transporter substrate-binding domain-containing protein n=1 Tax=Castellaniella defragrans TaxID=75697 RepID=UPI0023F04439|nr:transporter substrate-binding domain-containing protein [Castellaniella defragrans]